MYWDPLSPRAGWPLRVSLPPEACARAFRPVLPWSGLTATSEYTRASQEDLRPHREGPAPASGPPAPSTCVFCQCWFPWQLRASVCHALGSSVYLVQPHWPHNSTVRTERKGATSLRPRRWYGAWHIVGFRAAFVDSAVKGRSQKSVCAFSKYWISYRHRNREISMKTQVFGFSWKPWKTWWYWAQGAVIGGSSMAVLSRSARFLGASGHLPPATCSPTSSFLEPRKAYPTRLVISDLQTLSRCFRNSCTWRLLFFFLNNCLVEL